MRQLIAKDWLGPLVLNDQLANALRPFNPVHAALYGDLPLILAGTRS